MIETLQNNPEFEQNDYRERERKFLPIFRDNLTDLRHDSMPIEQFYLSHPNEAFSLRFRETFCDGELCYEATLKDRGSMTKYGLDRLEVEVPISKELYNFYKTDEAAIIHKLRAKPNRHVAVDFYDGGHVQIEAEDTIAWQQFLDHYGYNFVEVTGDRTADNEWRAHFAYRLNNDGRETLMPPKDLDVKQIANEIATAHAKQNNVVARISGRSGSGKSTIVREIKQELESYGLTHAVMSTDDYHRGAKWLQAYNNGEAWTEWDHPVVYDTQSMARDIHALQGGHAIPRRAIDFSDCTPTVNGEVAPTDVIIVEGIYAASPDLQHLATLSYDIPTPLATCIGRRLLRDVRERPQFADLEASLRYMLEQAEPMWRTQNV